MKKIYRPFYQLPYCCVPAILQWILYRRGLDILDQETIGVALGLRLPERLRYLLNNKDVLIMPDDSQEFGTQILKEKHSINNFFDPSRDNYIDYNYSTKSQKILSWVILNLHFSRQ